MASMYETIRDLPLLKGVSDEQISTFLEKTHLEFKNYEPGECVISTGDSCDMLRFIISGHLKCHRTASHIPSIEINYTAHDNSVLTPENIFGYNTTSQITAEAVVPTSIMQFHKYQYLNILQSDKIFLLNFLNYLSLSVQRSTEIVRLCPGFSLPEIMARIITCTTPTDAQNIKIICSPDGLKQLCNLSATNFDTSISQMKNSGLIQTEESGIFISSRAKLIEYALTFAETQ